jgi:hypothetical protein
MLLLSYYIDWCVDTKDKVLVKLINHNCSTYFNPETEQTEINDFYVWFEPSKENPDNYVIMTNHYGRGVNYFYCSDEKFMTKLSFDVNRFAKTVKQP